MVSEGKKSGFCYRVLVVDDEDSMRKLIVRILEQKGCQCITAADGLEALDLARRNPVDSVITDIVMPIMDGITLTKELLKQKPKLPIMVLTGYDNEYSSETAIGAGARDFIKKPFSIRELALRFHKMMADQETFLQVEAKRNDMVFHSEKRSQERIRELEREVDTLKDRLNSRYFLE